MRYLFKRVQDQGVMNTLFKFVSVPLCFLRDYSCPMAEREAWNRNRAAVLPVTMPFSFFLLIGKFNFFTEDPDEIAQNEFYGVLTALLLIPGVVIGILIKFKTNNTKGPEFLILTYALLSFVMSIAWISFTSDCIMDLLRLFGFILYLPRSLLALTILSWGNCIGDLVADLAMSKKGFAEMAITGTLAGPIFNILVGMGLSDLLKIFGSPYPFESTIRLSIYKKDETTKELVFDKASILPLVLVVFQIVTLVILFLNSIKTNYMIDHRSNLTNTVIYSVVVVFLVAYGVYINSSF